MLQIRAPMRMYRPDPIGNAMELSEMIKAYVDHQLVSRRPRGVDWYRKVLMRLHRFCDDRPLSRELVEAYINTRATKAPATIAGEITVISSFNRWLLKRGKGDPTLMDLVDRPTVRKGNGVHAPAEEIIKCAAWLASDANPRSRRFVGLCLYAGLRITEARLLDWSNVDMRSGWIHIRAETAKYGRPRRVPISPPLARLLDTVDAGQRRGAVAGRPGGAPLSVGGAEHVFDRELRKAGIIVTAHQLRRAFATRLDELGVSLRVIQELLGHSSVATTELYIGVNRNRLISAVQQLDGAFDA